ncbi:helix-turn-helix domain-containing protein [Candidatus Nitrososphaera gargensis]
MLNYKFRLYPTTKEQELALEQTLDGCRWVYTTTFLTKTCQSTT